MGLVCVRSGPELGATTWGEGYQLGRSHFVERGRGCVVWGGWLALGVLGGQAGRLGVLVLPGGDGEH